MHNAELIMQNRAAFQFGFIRCLTRKGVRLEFFGIDVTSRAFRLSKRVRLTMNRDLPTSKRVPEARERIRLVQERVPLVRERIRLVRKCV